MDLQYVARQSLEGVRRFFSPVRNIREIKYAVQTGIEESNKSAGELKEAFSVLTWKTLFRMIARALKKLLGLS